MIFSLDLTLVISGWAEMILTLRVPGCGVMDHPGHSLAGTQESQIIIGTMKIVTYRIGDLVNGMMVDVLILLCLCAKSPIDKIYSLGLCS